MRKKGLDNLIFTKHKVKEDRGKQQVTNLKGSANGGTHKEES